MPIKVQCQECSKVMAVPDKAAGRAVKCKECGSRVPVPSAGGGAKKKKRPRPAPEPEYEEEGDPDDLFGGIDLRRAENRREKLCPNCATQVDEEEDFECPNCGVNIETGVLSQKQRSKRARKGPDPEEFYGVVWSNGWKFVTNHWGFVIKTGITWALSITMVIVAAFVLKWYTTTRAIELRESAEGNVEFTEAGVLIAFGEDEGGGDEADYDGVHYTRGSTLLTDGRILLPPPEIAAWFSPPTYFWMFIFLIFILSFGGWAWTLSAKVVEITLAKEKKIKRFNSDIYGNMTKGCTTFAWPIVLMYPVIWIPAVMYFAGAGTQASLITFIAMFLIPYIVFLPIAVVHMAQPYGYRSWLMTWMSKDLLNTFMPNLFVSGLFFVTVLMLPLGIAIGVAVGWEQVANFYENTVEVNALGAIGYATEDAHSSGTFIFKRLPFLFIVCFTLGGIFFTLLAIPAVFMMRIFGLFGLYFRPDLALCAEQVPLSPAGFGPRFLAVQVDMIIGLLLGGAAMFCANLISGLVAHLYNSPAIAQTVWYVVAIGGTLGAFGFYFANWEAGSGRATLGKWTFGLLVLQEDNTPMPLDMALKRFAMSMLSVVSVSGTFTMCAFNPNKRALHDIATKTKVVWRGDENQ